MAALAGKGSHAATAVAAHSSAVANALAGLLSDAGTHQRLAEAGRQACVRRFGMRQVVDAYETRYAEIVSAAGAAHDSVCVRSL